MKWVAFIPASKDAAFSKHPRSWQRSRLFPGLTISLKSKYILSIKNAACHLPEEIYHSRICGHCFPVIFGRMSLFNFSLKPLLPTA
jgi:hypothetical protein